MEKHVLIVEDEFVVANSLRLLLQKADYNVTGIAASVDEALQLLKAQKPELVILDIRLNGEESGIDLARILKNEFIAFIYLSANSDQMILEKAKSTEPYGFMVKPFREKDLLITLDIAWYRHRHSNEAKLRREDYLFNGLSELARSKNGIKQDLIATARLFQPYVPFDLLFIAYNPVQSKDVLYEGYHRIGFNEYQYIGKDEFKTITDLKTNPFLLEGDASVREGEDAYFRYTQKHSRQRSTLFEKTFFDHFKIESYLSLPVRLSGNVNANYFFLSRQREVYNRTHVTLLNQLKPNLKALLEDISLHGNRFSATEDQPPVYHSETRVNDNPQNITGIIGDHPLLLSVLDLTSQVAPYNTSVLILGESGTGKELIAQSIHALSPRKDGPLVKINCGAIPESLIESELFGHKKGSFTGAIDKRKGKFELANGGTIFLDEIGELSFDLQVKLLRVLQDKEITPVGADFPQKVDVRIVAATNRNLEKEVADGRFRLDLYYRLNVFPITIPPLRDRKSDITALSAFFAKRFSLEFGKTCHGIAQSMMEQMQQYNWPGNIRELENVIERSVILNDGHHSLTLTQNLNAIPELPDRPNIETLSDVKQIQRETEKDYIISVLKKTGGRIRGASGAAELLNIKPTTLESKIAKLGILKTDF